MIVALALGWWGDRRALKASSKRLEQPPEYDFQNVCMFSSRNAGSGASGGGRIEYLRRIAAYHERESSKSSDPNDILNHAFAAAQFREAGMRPWTFVDDSPRR